jgi:16S rRNA (adenine1518-N6/adenine1519-N6)-dimethyltransferase
VQLEVAQRIAAPPGSRTYGILSVLLGAYYEVKLLFRVPPGAFRPPPKVQSAVLGLHRLPQPRCGADTDYPTLKLVTKTAFGQRRKTLANALKPLGLVPPPAWAGLRPENLSPEQFGELARLYRPSPTS